MNNRTFVNWFNRLPQTLRVSLAKQGLPELDGYYFNPVYSFLMRDVNANEDAQ